MQSYRFPRRTAEVCDRSLSMKIKEVLPDFGLLRPCYATPRDHSFSARTEQRQLQQTVFMMPNKTGDCADEWEYTTLVTVCWAVQASSLVQTSARVSGQSSRILFNVVAAATRSCVHAVVPTGTRRPLPPRLLSDCLTTCQFQPTDCTIRRETIRYPIRTRPYRILRLRPAHHIILRELLPEQRGLQYWPIRKRNHDIQLAINFERVTAS